MSDEADVPNTAATAPTTEETTRPSTEAVPSAGGDDATAESKTAGDDETANDAAPGSGGEPTDGDPSTKTDEAMKDGDAQDGPSTVATGGTENAKKDKKRRSSGVPEHKTKKLNKKKSMPDLHLNVQPGEYWYARMKGHPPWPSIICDEELIPPTLLEKRPVSAMRPDGSYREDYQEGGKNARDRRYPVMFLGTNEFAWQVNTDLLLLDMDELKSMVENNEQGKKSKSLWNAFEVASEEHDLDYFKGVLRDAEKARQEEIQKKEEAEAKKLEKKDKSKRKSTAGVGDDDVDMEDAEGDASVKKSKTSKKRKKDAESDGEGKPAKTPKTTKLKVNGPKPPKEEAAPKPKKSGKSKKAAKASEDSESPKPQEKQLTEAERKEKTQRSVLYLRHRLQKGFLNRADPPKEEEMPDMAEHFNNLEGCENLEASIIKGTKIHKVLKAIIKLDSIPRDDEFKFKERSQKLLGVWGKILASDLETPTTGIAEGGQDTATNGVKDEGEAGEAASDAPKTNGNAGEDTDMKDAPTETKVEETANKEQDSADEPKAMETDEAPKPAAVEAA